MKKIALIFGITGQDGSYLAEFLLKKNYIVHGLKRRTSILNTSRIDHIYNNKKYENKFYLHYSDILDSLNINALIGNILPDEIYNLAAQSHVAVSFNMPEYSSDVDAMGTLRILEVIKNTKTSKKIKFYQASSSEMFGNSSRKKQNENTNFDPQSPYACSKVFSFHITKVYRKAFNLFASNGILFNHESERRGENFITKKVVNAAYRISIGENIILQIGNLYSKRDWGYAPDYVEGIWKILQAKKPDDFVLATGKTYTVKYFIEKTFKLLNINIKWVGNGVNEKAINIKNNKTIVKVNKKYFRPLEVNYLQGDYSKAKKILKWGPKTSLNEMIKIMLTNEAKNFKEK